MKLRRGKTIPRTYVSFEFSPLFIKEGREREKDGSLKSGILEEILDRYDEVEITTCSLDKLQVPNGALRFYFYTRLTAITYFNGERVEMCTNKLACSAWHYLEMEGRVIETRREMSETLGTERAKQAAEIMKRHKARKVFYVPSSKEIFLLGNENCVIAPHQITVVQTEISWPVN